MDLNSIETEHGNTILLSIHDDVEHIIPEHDSKRNSNFYIGKTKGQMDARNDNMTRILSK